MSKISILSILNEDKQHLDDEIVDYNQINLQKEFYKLNGELFDDKIGDVKLEWNNRKTAHGFVRASINRITKEVNIKMLSISRFYEIPYKFFKDVLAHELIHVYLLQKGINADHGKEFIAEMNRINNMGLGYNVTITADASKFGISQGAIKKMELVFVIMKMSNKLALAVMNYKTYKNEAKNISKIFNNLIKSGKYKEVNAEFYISNSSLLQKEKVQRSFRSTISYRLITDEEFNTLKSNAKYLASFTCDNMGCMWDGPDEPNEWIPTIKVKKSFDLFNPRFI
jgi:predicted SprT family Zn-dependent metalloprotease